MSTTDEQGKAFGYVCYICGEQIYDSQPTEHSEHGLIHLNCIPALLAANDELEKRVKELEAERGRFVHALELIEQREDGETVWSHFRHVIDDYKAGEFMGVPSEQLSGPDRNMPGKPNLKNPRTPIPTKVYAEGWPADYLCKCDKCLQQFYGAKRDNYCPACHQTALEKENAELRKDKERLDWLIEWHGLNEGPLPCRDWNDAEDARQAIDSAAREAK